MYIYICLYIYIYIYMYTRTCVSSVNTVRSTFTSPLLITNIYKDKQRNIYIFRYNININKYKYISACCPECC